MKKAILPTLIALSLSACGGGDSSDSESPINPPSLVNALFFDANAIQGASFECDSGDSGLTNSLGQFSVKSGATCEFSLDGFSLGKTNSPITSESSLVTSYNLAEAPVSLFSSSSNTSQQYAANISALLQSIDIDSNDDVIDTRSVVGDSIPSDLLAAADDNEFALAASNIQVQVSESEEPKSISEAGGDIKKPSEAIEEVNKQFKSENVAAVVEAVKALMLADISTIDLEAELNDYRSLLETEDNSNGYHQAALSAIIEIAEVLNMEEVAQRVEFENSGYSEMLVQVLDYYLNPGVIFEVIDVSLGTTEDVSKVLTSAADRLVHASEKLGAAMPGEGYKLDYTDDGITYQDSLVLRAAALAVANSLYVSASYNAGDDTYYVPQEEILEGVNLHAEVSSYAYDQVQHEGGTELREWHDLKQDIEVEHEVFLYDPKSHYESPLLFGFHDNADQLLGAAKTAVENAVDTALMIDLSKYLSENEAEQLAIELDNLNKHLADKNSAYTTTLSDGSEVSINLHAFFDVTRGIDRSDLVITVGEYICDRAELGDEINASYDVTYSKLQSEPLCSHDGQYLVSEDSESGYGSVYLNYDLIKKVYSSWEQELEDGVEYSKFTHVFVPAVDAIVDVDIQESSESTIKEVVWCGVDDTTGEKVECFIDELNR